MESTIGVILERLDKHIVNSDKRHDETAAVLRDYKSIIDSKVSYKQFTWIIGIMVLILLAMFGYIAMRMDALTSTSAQTQTDVSYLTGKLAPYDVKYSN